MAEMAVLVPPGRAYRDGKAQTEWSRKNAQKHGRKTVELLDAVDSEVVKNDRIKRGARRLAYQAIWHQKRSGHVEFYAEGDTKMVRLGSIPWEVGSE